MATFNKFYPYIEYLAKKKIDHLNDTHKVMLTNTAPTSANGVKADLTEISSGNGYTAGGNAATVSSCVQTSGTLKLVLADPATWTASGGNIGPFRYVVLYDDTPTSPADPLVGWWDYGSSITLADTETFTHDLDATNGVLTLA